MLVYLKDGSAHTSASAATLRQKLQIKLPISPGDRILTPGQPVPALTLKRQVPGRVAIGVPRSKSLVRLDPEKSPRHKRESKPGSASLEADPLTTRPTRRPKGGKGKLSELHYDHLLNSTVVRRPQRARGIRGSLLALPGPVIPVTTNNMLIWRPC